MLIYVQCSILFLFWYALITTFGDIDFLARGGDISEATQLTSTEQRMSVNKFGFQIEPGKEVLNQHDFWPKKVM